MLIVDQLKKGDRQLQTVAVTILLALAVLLAGLWYVQIMSAKRYRENLASQSFRTVRLPAIRGKIFDRHGVALAENRPSFNVNLYLEDLRELFTHEYTNTVKKEYLRDHPDAKLTLNVRNQLQATARYRVVSNIVARIGAAVQQPLFLNEKRFLQHYLNERALPLTVLKDLTSTQVAMFVENSGDLPGVELEIQPVRTYPFKTTAAHLLGHLRREDRPEDEEEIMFKYRLPDFVGVTGIEGVFDRELRGKAGAKSMLVDNLGYRQREFLRQPAEPGHDVRLTIDRSIQHVAELALESAYANARGAAVVMDCQSGDLLAIASSPAFDPNQFVLGITPEEMQWLNDPKLKPQFNRATQGAYTPGSIFKIIVGLACLESGVVHPEEIYKSLGYYQFPRRRRPIGDTAPAGDYDFRRAFILSCNSYFIHYGLQAGPKKIIELGRQARLGEPTGLFSAPAERPGAGELAGYFPEPNQRVKKDGSPWMDGDTANFSIGQGELMVTPLQMAVMTTAIANGGTILTPRVVANVTGAGQEEKTPLIAYRSGVVRGHLQVKPRHLEIVREAMRADVEAPEGTGKAAAVPGLTIGGKTGTAEIRRGRGIADKVTWFVSFAPVEKPKYAVVVMVESGASGALTCAPVAQKIYRQLQKLERETPPGSSLANVN